MAKKLNKYKVSGTFEGRRVDRTVRKFSAKQAKFVVGLEEGFRGNQLSRFSKSSKIKVRLVN